jgi:hypothetical protein
MISQDPKSDKARVWDVVGYEVLMFLGTSHVRKHLKGGNGPNTQIIRNALVESSLLHMRILADIFLSRGSKPDDIHLEELGFVVSGQDDVLADKIGAFEKVYGKSSDKNSKCWIINKMLAHPTTHRSDRYAYGTVFNELDIPLKSIIEYIYSSTRRQLPYPLESAS